MTKLNIKKIWLIIYTFLAIFEPPILPVPLIYILGALTVCLILLKYKTKIPLIIVTKSGISRFVKIFIVLFCYLIIINIFNITLVESKNLIENRLRCINQLIILTFIQFLQVWYILILSENLNHKLKDIFKIITISGVLQGISALFAYNFPGVRALFIKYSDKVLFNNPYFFERRGFGFSMTLIDTFGYGMGLIGGYILLQNWKEDKLLKLISLFLVIFSIFVNARTGIIILGIAIFIKLMQSKNKLRLFMKIVIFMPVIYSIIYKIFPFLLELGNRSKNITVKWVFTALEEAYNILLKKQNSNASFTNATFFDNFGNLPTNIFEYIFGSGHSIYDTKYILGFRTDIGYINLWWEFGLIGLICIVIIILVWMIKALKMSKDIYIKSIVLFNIFSYFLVLFKAILIGYNPGIFINYLVIFSIYYYNNKTKLE